MKKQLSLLAIGCVLSGAVSAQTLFTGTVDADFANAGNWDVGEPSNANIGTIKDGLTAVSSVDDNAGVIIGADGTAGTLDITGGLFHSDSGDMKVGVGAGSIGTVNVAAGATLQTKGSGADLFIGDLAGGYGTVNINAGATYDAVKAIEIIMDTPESARLPMRPARSTSRRIPPPIQTPSWSAAQRRLPEA